MNTLYSKTQAVFVTGNSEFNVAKTYIFVAQEHSTFPHVMSETHVTSVTTTQRNLTICR